MDIRNVDFINLESARKKKKIATFSLVIGTFLMLLKFYAFHITDSRAILSDALESIINVVAGFITIAVLFYSLKPADLDHPYGHGKIESMAATFEGGAILFAGVIIILDSLRSLIDPIVVRSIDLGLGITIFAGGLNGVIGYFLLRMGKNEHSEALISSGSHLISDAWTSLGIILGLIVVKLTNILWLDPVIAIIFGLFLVYSGAKILINSSNTLMDALDEKISHDLLNSFEKHYRPGIIDIHFTRVIRSGENHHVDTHIVIPENWSILDSHEFIDQFESDIAKEYGARLELNVHLDPCRKNYCKSCELENCKIRVESFKSREKTEIGKLISPSV